MASTGRLREILKVGIKLAISATTTATARMRAICRIPKFKTLMERLYSFFSDALMTLVTTPVAIELSTKFISAIMTLSTAKMPYTSLPRAPTARKIPISLRLYEILVEMKFVSISAAKTAKPIPIYKNIFDVDSTKSFTLSSVVITPFLNEKFFSSFCLP